MKVGVEEAKNSELEDKILYVDFGLVEVRRVQIVFSYFFFNDTATTEIYTLSLHDALPIYPTPSLLPQSKTNDFQ